jgi:hypothetical protein
MHWPATSHDEASDTGNWLRDVEFLATGKPHFRYRVTMSLDECHLFCVDVGVNSAEFL